MPLYFALAALFFARGLDGRWSTAYIGKGVDPPQLMWLMAWWPHALAHGLNPLFTDAIWAPARSQPGLGTSHAAGKPDRSRADALTVGPVRPTISLCVLAARARGLVPHSSCVAI